MSDWCGTSSLALLGVASAAGVAAAVTTFQSFRRGADVATTAGGRAKRSSWVNKLMGASLDRCRPGKRVCQGSSSSADALAGAEVLSRPEEQPATDAFPLMDLVGQAVFLDICKNLPAKSIAALKAVCKEMYDGLNCEEAARWVVETRDWERVRIIHRTGDLPLPAGRDAEWTLEKLHLAEEPPRFSSVQFSFASSDLEPNGPNHTVAALEDIAHLMVRHKSMSIRVTGFTQPDAPEFIAVRISAARALSVAMYLICRISGLAVTNANARVALSLLGEQPPQRWNSFAVDSDHSSEEESEDEDGESDEGDEYSESEDGDYAAGHEDFLMALPGSSFFGSDDEYEGDGSVNEHDQESNDTDIGQESDASDSEDDEDDEDGGLALLVGSGAYGWEYSAPGHISQSVTVALPRGEDLTSPMLKLPDLASRSCRLVHVQVDKKHLTERLKAAARRLEQEEDRRWDLADDRRVEFTLLSV